MASFGAISVLPIASVPEGAGSATRQITFSAFTQTSLLDWNSVEYSSFLYTYYIVPEESMTWMQSPYIYVFLENGNQQDVIDSTGAQVVDSNGTLVVEDEVSCKFNAIWDWSNTDEANTVIDSTGITVVNSAGVAVIDSPTSVKASRDIEVYRFRDGNLLGLSKNKIRGRGKTLQLKFSSIGAKDFDLKGWAGWISKNSRY